MGEAGGDSAHRGHASTCGIEVTGSCPHSLSPRGRILFWTDWDASLPRIEAASMSGEGRRTIHKETGSGGWPNGLTVDYLEKRILWIDAR